MVSSLYLTTTPLLLSFTADEAVFVFRREPLNIPPPLRELVTSFLLAVFFAIMLLIMIFRPLPSHRVTAFLVFGGSFVFFTVRGLLLRRHRIRYQDVPVLCPPGFFVVRFSRNTGACNLIGPVPSLEAARTTELPILVTVPLIDVKLFDGAGPSDPWSDSGGDLDSARLYFWIPRAPHRDLQQHFDLLEGIQPDFRWYVSLTNPEFLRRREQAKELLNLQS
jgi:hypothetical protein